RVCRVCAGNPQNLQPSDERSSSHASELHDIENGGLCRAQLRICAADSQPFKELCCSTSLSAPIPVNRDSCATVLQKAGGRPLGHPFETETEKADQLEGPLFLIGQAAQLKQRGQRIPVDPEVAEDRYRLRDRPLQVFPCSQPDVHLGEVERNDRGLIEEVTLRKALTGLQQRYLGGPQVTEVAQELRLLPPGAQDDQRVAEVAVKVLDISIDGKRLLGLPEVDVAADQVVAGGEQEVRVALAVDPRQGAVEQAHCGLHLAGVDRGDGPLNQSGGERAAVPEVAIDAPGLFGEIAGLLETPLEDAQRGGLVEQRREELGIAGPFLPEAESRLQSLLGLSQAARHAERVAELAPGLGQQIGQPWAASGLGCRASLGGQAGHVGEVEHPRRAVVPAGVALLDKPVYHGRMSKAGVVAHSLELLALGQRGQAGQQGGGLGNRWAPPGEEIRQRSFGGGKGETVVVAVRPLKSAGTAHQAPAVGAFVKEMTGEQVEREVVAGPVTVAQQVLEIIV